MRDALIRRTVRCSLTAALLAVGLAAGPAGAGLPDEEARTTLPEPTTATVTAAQLGRGSTVAVITTAGFDERPSELTTSLEVITPDGVRHPVYSVSTPFESDAYVGDFHLADWRPETHTALLRVVRGHTVPDRLVAYDVTTGEMRTTTMPRRGLSAGLDPAGAGVLLALSGHGPRGRLVARGWDGTTTRLPGTTGGAPITSVDGRTLVTGAGERRTWWIIDLAGRRGTELEPPGGCGPIRWLDSDSIVASCYTEGDDSGNQLMAVHLDGTSTRLGTFHPFALTRRLDILADGDVRRAGGKRWYVTWRRCGSGVVTAATRSGDRRRVPGTTGLDTLVGTRGDRLLLARGGDQCRDGRGPKVLELLDPRTGTAQVLTRLAEGEWWRSVIGATEVRHWAP
ncbi:hypothetical protein [Nocardioides zhouii]|uniref:WD40 repeat domain-containing protein n=1 Tax=Nocardioides zhouii TaxID=1168729 RepID=A0A4Q2T865_9ACTN|nr:hypothetical protein [Nocardioides zhouii]RYC13264.1 hypothetical protein EUA94_05145 [Nocardioides zhouii]